MSWRDKYLDLAELSAEGDGRLLLSGHVRTPLDPAKLKAPVDFFTQDGEVDIALDSEELSLATVMGLIHEEPPLDCRVSADVAVTGMLRDLDATGALRVLDIVVPKAEQVPPAALAVDFAVGEERFSLRGELSHPQIQPFRLEGNLPFRPESWVNGSVAIMDEPLEARATMAESSLAFVTGYTDAVERIDGVMGVDVSAGGTLADLKVNGRSEIRIADLVLANPSAPSMRNFEALLLFKDRELRVEKLGGLVAGGMLGLTGTVGFPIESADGEPGPAGPVFDLTIDGDEVLIARNESLSLRANVDLGLAGPFEAIDVTGQIGITGSRFFKDIDILAAGGGGGGGESAIPEVEPGPKMPLPDKIEVGVPIEPFKNWSADIDVVTLDPFVIGGNLMRARIRSDLNVSGQLEAPVPNGRVWMEEGVLRLPFSRIEVATAEVAFDEATSFNGRLNVKATSNVSDYRVAIFAGNRVLDPNIILSSVPPLPREDILVLLGTGATRDALAGGGGTTAAVKSLLLVAGGSAKNARKRVDPDAGPGFLETISERSQVELGVTDPETGLRTTNATFRLWQNMWLGGRYDERGGYRGILKYVFRMR